MIDSLAEWRNFNSALMPNKFQVTNYIYTLAESTWQVCFFIVLHSVNGLKE